MYPNGPANNGQMPITQTPPGDIGGTSAKSVTLAVPPVQTIGPNPPAADFIPPPGRGEPANPTRTAGTVG